MWSSLLFCLLFLLSVDAYNVLIYNPKFGFSHMKYMNQIGTILVEAGHNVTVIHPIINHLERDIQFAGTPVIFPQDHRTKAVSEERLSDPDGAVNELWTQELDMGKMTEMMLKLYVHQCESSMLQKDILDKLSETKFDIAIGEVFDSCGHGLFEMLKIPAVISASSSILIDHQAKIFGVPMGHSYVPSTFMGGESEKMTLREKFWNFFGSYMGESTFFAIMDAHTELFQKHVSPDFRNLRDVVAESSYMITNTIPILDYPRPTIHKVIGVGGIGVATVKPLNEEWSEILSRRHRNVYISFGSIAKSYSMPQHYKDSVIQVAKEMKDVTFIWKYEKDDLKNLPENLILSKWTPQNDLLADKRLSLFITHGGLGSVTEVAMSGCVALLVPLFAEQPRNAGMLRRHRGAEVFSKYDLPQPDKLKAAIENLLENKEYRQNAETLSELINNAPFSAKELLVKHVEFAAKYGKLPQLDHYGRKQSFIEYYLLDLSGYCLAIVLSIVFIIFYFSRVIGRKLQIKLKQN